MGEKNNVREGFLIESEEAKKMFLINQTPPMDTYVAPILNQVNIWAGGTSEENVGMVSQVIKDFREENPQGTLEDWKQYHQKLEGINGIDQSVKDIRTKLDDVLSNLNNIKDEDIRKWVENLTYEKTFCGLSAQEMILKKMATDLGYDYSLGNREDEKQGIDGYINKKPLQIKSSSYRNKNKQEKFNCPIIFYDLTPDGIEFNYNDEIKKYING